MSDTKESLEETPPDALRAAFLTREFEADPDLERRFHSFLNTSALHVYKHRSERGAEAMKRLFLSSITDGVQLN